MTEETLQNIAYILCQPVR